MTGYYVMNHGFALESKAPFSKCWLHVLYSVFLNLFLGTFQFLITSVALTEFLLWVCLGCFQNVTVGKTNPDWVTEDILQQLKNLTNIGMSTMYDTPAKNRLTAGE